MTDPDGSYFDPDHDLVYRGWGRSVNDDAPMFVLDGTHDEFNPHATFRFDLVGNSRHNKPTLGLTHVEGKTKLWRYEFAPDEADELLVLLISYASFWVGVKTGQSTDTSPDGELIQVKKTIPPRVLDRLDHIQDQLTVDV